MSTEICKQQRDSHRWIIHKRLFQCENSIFLIRSIPIRFMQIRIDIPNLIHDQNLKMDCHDSHIAFNSSLNNILCKTMNSLSLCDRFFIKQILNICQRFTKLTIYNLNKEQWRIFKIFKLDFNLIIICRNST